jgi:acetyltransferase-like isoleucine patch superfamily enzyme
MIDKVVRYTRRHGVITTVRYGWAKLRNVYYTQRLRAQGVRVGRNLWFDGPIDITIIKGGSITIGNGCNFGKYCHLKVSGGRIVLKENVKINRFCIVQAHRSVVIERDVLTAPGVHIMDANHNFQTEMPTKVADEAAGLPTSPVVIGAHAWLGSGVRVLAGVRIGAHAVIGAGAVVTNDIPDHAVAVGVPCRVIKYRDQVAR